MPYALGSGTELEKVRPFLQVYNLILLKGDRGTFLRKPYPKQGTIKEKRVPDDIEPQLPWNKIGSNINQTR